MSWRGRAARFGVAAATVTVLAVPTVTFAYVRTRVQVGVRDAAADAGPLSDADRAVFAGWSAAAFVVLGYHDLLSPDGATEPPPSDGRRLSVDAATFAAHLRMLKLAGFQSVTAKQVQDHVTHGTPLPARAVLITFDGARARLWSQADPLLKEYGFHAVVFVDPAFVGRAKGTALTWPTLRKMAGTGRWSVGVAAPNGTVATDADGSRASALVAHEWLDRQHRSETTAEFTSRVRDSIDRSRRKLGNEGLTGADLLSFPFQPGFPLTRVRSAFAELVTAAGASFPASVLTTSPDDAVDPTWTGKRVLPRIEVYRATTDRLLFARIKTATGT
jgi:peptidoglycan/xylan/chitin deacetylase (PgdA/CDA1 family)